jgi:acetolactate synthase-1/2/3 large subunit
MCTIFSSSSFPMAPERIVADLREALPEDSHLCLDNGLYKLFVARNYPAARRNCVLLDNALATMGAMVGSAIASKLVHPDSAVIGIAGDGGFLMNGIQELETCVRLHKEGLIKNLVLCVLNDGGYGMIRWKNAKYPDPDFALKFGNPDFLLIAEAFGVHGHRVHSAAALAPLLRLALNTDGIHLIDIPMSYDRVEEVLAGYKSAAAAAE